jgi:predicted Fe-Mo cluster-binding NifX family protein
MGAVEGKAMRPQRNGRTAMLCVTARGPGLGADIDPRFGRAAYYVFVDDAGAVSEGVENQPGAHGAGVQAGQIVAQRKPEAVITGAVGPNAMQTLGAAGIKVYIAEGGTVSDAVQAFRAGTLTLLNGPTAQGHGGRGR